MGHHPYISVYGRYVRHVGRPDSASQREYRDFFNASEDSLITFHSDRIVQTGPTTFHVQGKFTLRAVSKPETRNLTISGKGTGTGDIKGLYLLLLVALSSKSEFPHINRPPIISRRNNSRFVAES